MMHPRTLLLYASGSRERVTQLGGPRARICTRAAWLMLFTATLASGSRKGTRHISGFCPAYATEEQRQLGADCLGPSPPESPMGTDKKSGNKAEKKATFSGLGTRKGQHPDIAGR